MAFSKQTEFQVDDLVWAKMKGFPPWPARIIEPSSSVKVPKSKSDSEFLRFLGTGDVAWIQRKDITHHSESMLQDAKNKKKTTKNYQKSINELLFLENSESKKQSLSDVQEAVGNKKKLTKVVKIIKTAPNKRGVLHGEKSRIKRISKKKPTNNREKSPDNSLVSNQEDADVSETPSITCDLTDDLTYGFMGLSTFGRAVLLKLLKSGLKISLWHPSIDEVMKCIRGIKGIKPANSPAELIKNCHITFCCYESDSKELVDIVHGEESIIKGFDEAEKLGRKPGYVHLTYIDHKTSKLIYEATLAKKAMYLEAPIYGSCEDIDTCKAIINASGDQHLFQKCQKCFDLIAVESFYIGSEVSISSSTNMVLNGLTGTISTAIAETLALADKLSVNLFENDLSQLVSQMLVNTNIMERVEQMGIHTTEAVMPLKHVQKVLNLGLAEADKVNQRMPMTAAANELYKRARQLNYSDADVSAIYRVIKY